MLFWGILGALIMRVIFIAAGLTLLHYFHWIIYVFGALLVFTGWKMLTKDEVSIHPEKNPVLRLLRRRMPISDQFEGHRFFVMRQGQRFATPLLGVLAVVETTDLVFAVDSIPAVIAITRDPFIVYTSNVFAILGLRALYFVLSGVMDLFHYLRHGLGLVLVFVGIKMLISNVYKIPIAASLGVIGVVLAVAVVASLIRNRGLARVVASAEEATGSE
ncbi:MAG: TerC/Alx family metal homeostasis membrane protein [bacterium]